MGSFGAWTKNTQAIATEVADIPRNLRRLGRRHGKLMGAKSLEKAMEVQSEYVKYATKVSLPQSTRIGELYTGLAKEATSRSKASWGSRPS